MTFCGRHMHTDFQVDDAGLSLTIVGSRSPIHSNLPETLLSLDASKFMTCNFLEAVNAHGKQGM